MRVVSGSKGQTEDRWILAMHATSQRDRHMVDDIFEENEANQCGSASIHSLNTHQTIDGGARRGAAAAQVHAAARHPGDGV